MKWNRFKTLLLVFGISSCLILLNMTQRAVIALTAESQQTSALRALAADAALWYLWGAAVFPVYFFARRISLNKTRKAFALFLHLLLGFVFSLAIILLQAALVAPLFDDSIVSMIQTAFFAKLFMRTSIYFLIAIACYVYILHQRSREEELKARELETRVVVAQFQVLKSKLNPEFLFSTLQSISNLMRNDIEAADLLTARLGDSLRLSLDNSCVGSVPLLNEEREDASTETFFGSLDEFHLSLARQEERIQNSKPSFRKRFSATIGIWTLIAIFFLLRELLTRVAAAEPLQFVQNIKETVAWYWWALLTPLVFYLARKFPLRPGSLKKNVSFHVLFGFVISFSMVFLYLGQRWAFGFDNESVTFREIFIGYPYMFDVLTYLAIVLVHDGLTYHREYLLEELRTAKLKGNLMEAQVQALKMQLHPHFLFNALNSISELMHEDLDAAENMLKRLEDFLRLTFQNSDVQEITLQKELEFLRNYLEIQQVRFQNRLKVDLNIDPRVMKDRVPNLILQPIVENAIRHGVSPRIDSGRVEIRAFHKDGKLMLEVEDDGPGLTGGSFREGVGMSNTRMRLEQMYGKQCRFRVQNNPHGGLVVTLQIPAMSEPRIVT